MASVANYNAFEDMVEKLYSYTNCVPQKEFFNRGSWRILEVLPRNWLSKVPEFDSAEIISGPIFHSLKTRNEETRLFESVSTFTRKEAGAIVPPQMYKIIKMNKGN